MCPLPFPDCVDQAQRLPELCPASSRCVSRCYGRTHPQSQLRLWNLAAGRIVLLCAQAARFAIARLGRARQKERRSDAVQFASDRCSNRGVHRGGAGDDHTSAAGIQASGLAGNPRFRANHPQHGSTAKVCGPRLTRAARHTPLFSQPWFRAALVAKADFERKTGKCSLTKLLLMLRLRHCCVL